MNESVLLPMDLLLQLPLLLVPSLMVFLCFNQCGLREKL